MDKITILGLVCSSICLVGFYLAYLYGRCTKKFLWKEYVAIIVWPLLSVIILMFFIGIDLLKLFVISMIVGTIFELLLGFVYEKVLNQKLWKYNQFSIKGYTSLLSIPLWGIAGVVFWSIGKIVGL